VQADLSRTEDVDRLSETLKESGGLEVLVNNAGMTIDAPLFSAKLDDFDRQVATNMRSTWYVTKRLSRLMIRARHGRIINISSIVGSTGNPTQSVYGMTKAAIDNFTKTAAMELAGYNILVNSVAPGFIQTRMTESLDDSIKQAILGRIPMGRMGTADEVAEVVRFLAVSGSYCTGSVFHVNGGMFGG
jgi:3-oxoacyl-[acyl-carrier protein] reductase